MKLHEKLKTYSEPIAIFTIGISGSGKSFLFNKKNFRSWNILSADDLRKQHLVKMKHKKKCLVVNGRKELANPTDPAHIFHAQLRDWVFDESLKQINRLAIKRQNLVLDLTNIHLQRVYAFNLLRKYNYTLVAAVFKPRATAHHLRNVKKRKKAGGIDLSPKDATSPDKVRKQIIIEQKKCMRVFLKNLKKGTCKFEVLPKVTPADLKTSLPSFGLYLKSLSPQALKGVKKLSRLDRVDDIVTI